MAPLNRHLEQRLSLALRHLADAEGALSAGAQDDDGAARSLLNDLRYLRARYDERLRIEHEAAR